MVEYNIMRRSEREINDFSEILDVLRRTQTIRLGLNGDPFPYVVPLSFGFKALGGCAGGVGSDSVGAGDMGVGGVVIYVHGAAEGLKHELLDRDNHVCVEADIFYRNIEHGEADSRSITAEYDSFIGFGTAEAAVGADAEEGMDLLLEHCGFSGFIYDKAALDKVKVYKFTLTDVKGKRCRI